MIYLYLNKHLIKGQRKGPSGRCSEACPDSSKFVVLEVNTQKYYLCKQWQLAEQFCTPQLSHHKVALHISALERQLNVPGCPWVRAPMPCGMPCGPWALWSTHMFCLCSHLRDLFKAGLKAPSFEAGVSSGTQEAAPPPFPPVQLSCEGVLHMGLKSPPGRRWLSCAPKIACFTERVGVMEFWTSRKMGGLKLGKQERALSIKTCKSTFHSPSYAIP